MSDIGNFFAWATQQRGAITTKGGAGSGRYPKGSGEGDGDRVQHVGRKTEETGPYFSNAADLGEVKQGKMSSYNGYKEMSLRRDNKNGAGVSPTAHAVIRQRSKESPTQYEVYLGRFQIVSGGGYHVGTVDGLKAAKEKATQMLGRVVSVDIHGVYEIKDTFGDIATVDTRGSR